MDNESARIYIPLTLQPYLSQACHTGSSLPLGRRSQPLQAESSDVIHRSAESIFHAVAGACGTTLSTRFRSTPRLVFRCPVLSLPLPSGPDTTFSLAVRPHSRVYTANNGPDPPLQRNVGTTGVQARSSCSSWGPPPVFWSASASPGEDFCLFYPPSSFGCSFVSKRSDNTKLPPCHSCPP